jgi:hypothetical protein
VARTPYDPSPIGPDGKPLPTGWPKGSIKGRIVRFILPIWNLFCAGKVVCSVGSRCGICHREVNPSEIDNHRKYFHGDDEQARP